MRGVLPGRRIVAQSVVAQSVAAQGVQTPVRPPLPPPPDGRQCRPRGHAMTGVLPGQRIGALIAGGALTADQPIAAQGMQPPVPAPPTGANAGPGGTR